MWEVAVVTLLLALIACGPTEAPAPPPAEPVAAPAAPPEAPVEAGKLAVAVAPEGAKVFFVEPLDGAAVKSPVKLVFGLDGMALKPAGDGTPASGHHHVVIDGEPLVAGTVVPSDATHVHFGKAQTETTVELAPGPHKLTLQFADANHVSYGAALSQTITVTVQP